MKPKILHRYIFYELASPFALGLLIFTFILLMNKILRLVDLLINKGVSLGEVFTLIWYLMPSFLVLTLPMSILLAILIALGKFSSDAELMAMKASGVSLYQMLPPFALLCAFGFAVTNLLTLYLLPKGNYAFRTELVEIAKRHSEANLEEGIFIDTFDGFVLYINSFDKEEAQVHGIFLIDKRDTKQQTVIVAQTATIIADQNSTTIFFKLQDGTIHRFDPKSLHYEYALFNNYDMNIPLQDIDDDEPFRIKYKEMEIGALWALSKERQEKKSSAIKINVEIQKRLSYPFACLVFGILGVSVGSFWRRGGRSYGFILSLVIVFVYYICMNLGENLARSGAVFTIIGVWLPNILLGGAGLYLFRKAAREKPLPFLVWSERIIGRAIDSGLVWLRRKRDRAAV
jgi:lipopolysaccharide export system permease protein